LIFYDYKQSVKLHNFDHKENDRSIWSILTQTKTGMACVAKKELQNQANVIQYLHKRQPRFN